VASLGIFGKGSVAILNTVLNPSTASPWQLMPESTLLAAWYDCHAVVRRLWGARTNLNLRVILAIEATHDNDDLMPVWLTNYSTWLHELQGATRMPVTLELFGSYPFESVRLHPQEILIADLCWRDPTVDAPGEWPGASRE